MQRQWSWWPRERNHSFVSSLRLHSHRLFSIRERLSRLRTSVSIHFPLASSMLWLFGHPIMKMQISQIQFLYLMAHYRYCDQAISRFPTSTRSSRRLAWVRKGGETEECCGERRGWGYCKRRGGYCWRDRRDCGRNRRGYWRNRGRYWRFLLSNDVESFISMQTILDSIMKQKKKR